MAATGLRVKNLRQMHRALKEYDDDVKRGFEDRLRDAGQIVASDAAQRFSTIDVHSAAGFKPRVKGFGRVVVQQSRRRKTGLRPDFGSLQMRRALLPALASNEQRIADEVEDMLDWAGRLNGF